MAGPSTSFEDITEEELRELGFEPAQPAKKEASAALPDVLPNYDDISEDDLADLGFEPLQIEVTDSKEEEPQDRKKRIVPESSFDASKPMATTYDSLYYGGEDGAKLKQREGELRTALSDEFRDTAMTPEEVETMRMELDQIEAKKQANYDKVQGDNVTDMGALGKIVYNEDGSKNYVPSPQVNEAAQVPLKTISDTARGILGLPELFGMEGYQDLVPKVSSEDEAVVVVSELAQLTMGGFGGMAAADRLKRLAALEERLPALNKLLNYVPKKATVQGTVSSTLGTVAVADEDIQTLFGDPDMTMQEAKLQVLKEGIAAGMILKGFTVVGRGLAAVPGIRMLGSMVSKTIAMMMAKGDKVDDIVITRLAERLNEGTTRLARAKTPEEVEAAHLYMYDAADQAILARTGMNLEDFAIKASEGIPEGTYVPHLGEMFDDKSLMRMYTGIRLSSSKDKALQIMSEAFKKNEDMRLDAIAKQVDDLFEQYAPEGKMAAEAVRSDVAVPAYQREMDELATQRELGTADTVDTQRMAQSNIAREEQAALTQAEQAREQATGLAEQRTAQTVEEQQAAMRQAEEARMATAEDVKLTMEESRIAPSNLDNLINEVDEAGIVAPISAQLRNDIQVKDELANVVRQEYDNITLTTDDLADVLEGMIPKGGTTTLLSEAEIQAASKPVRRLINAMTNRMPKEGEEGVVESVSMFNTEITDQIKQLQAALETTTDRVEYMRLVKQIAELVRKGGKQATPAPTSPTPTVGTASTPKSPTAPPTAPVQPTAAPEEELPALTLNELWDVRKAAGAQSADLKSLAAQQSLGSQERMAVGKYLGDVTSVLDAKIMQLTENVPTASAAREEFDTFFKGTFSERWRTETGREWQERIFNPMNEADVVAATERIVKVVANPQASKADIAQLKNVVADMGPEAVTAMANNVAPRVAADFAAKNKALLMPKDEPIQTVAQAEAALRAIDRYLAGTRNYTDVLPGADRILLETRQTLADVVSNARSAQAMAAETTTVGKATIKEAEAAGKSAMQEAASAERAATKQAQETAKQKTRELDAETRAQLASVNRAFDDAQKELDKSALKRLIDFESEPAEFFAKAMNDPKKGFSDIQMLWNKADESQRRAIQQAVSEALLSKTRTAVAAATDEARVAMAPLLDAIETKGSTANKVLNFVFKDNPDGTELFRRLGASAASLRKSQAMRGVEGSVTADKLATEAAMKDLNRVIFGPLTQKARMANFVTKISMKAFGTDAKIAEAYARILTDPNYAKKVLDRAAQLKKEAMMPEEEAVGKALLTYLMSSIGYKEYEAATDPWAMMEEHYNSYTTGAETEEAFAE